MSGTRNALCGAQNTCPAHYPVMYVRHSKCIVQHTECIVRHAKCIAWHANWIVWHAKRMSATRKMRCPARIKHVRHAKCMSSSRNALSGTQNALSGMQMLCPARKMNSRARKMHCLARKMHCLARKMHVCMACSMCFVQHANCIVWHVCPARKITILACGQITDKILWTSVRAQAASD